MLCLYNYCSVQLILTATELEDAQASSLAGGVWSDAPALSTAERCFEMLCSSQPACGGHCFHVALELSPKNAISQTRDDMEWTQLWIGAQGLHPAKAVSVFWHCLGSVVALQGHCGVKRVFWQPPGAIGPSGPPCILHMGAGMVGLQRVSQHAEDWPLGALKAAVLPLGLGLAPAAWAGCQAGAAGEDSSSKDTFGTRLSLSTEGLSWWWRNNPHCSVLLVVK